MAKDLQEQTRPNWTGRIAALFVRNGRLSLLLVIALFLWGGISYFATPKQYNPRIVAPAFQIIVDFPGASRSEALEQVTKPLENVVTDIPGVEDVYSVTEKGGRSVVNVNFFVGEDANAAKITLNDKIQSNLNLRPLGVEGPMIRSVDPDDVPVIQIALTSDKLNPVELRKFGFRLRDRLTVVDGARNLEVVGGRRRELAILFDPEKLAQRGVGVQQIKQALERSNVYLPSGLIKGEEAYVPLEATSIVQKPEDLENIVVVTGDFGQTRLKDVARVEERVREIESYVRHLRRTDAGDVQTAESVAIVSVAKLAEANISTVTASVKTRLAELEGSAQFIPDSVNYEVIVNEGDTAAREIQGLVANLFTAVGIVVVILFVFLDARAALLVAISIPLTLACVFGAAQLTGLTINRITLFALILSLGLLVDNATVVIENIVRRLQLGESQDRRGVIIAAVAEVGPGLFMATITTVLAFIPMAFVTGMMGPYMGPIPFFVPAALAFALFLSYSINPWMASVLLGRESRRRPLPTPAFLQAVLARGKNVALHLFTGYRRYLHRLLTERGTRVRALSVIGVLLAVSLALPGVTLVKFRMLPKADKEQFFLYLDLPAGTPLEETLRVAREYEAELFQNPQVTQIQSYVGQPPILDFNGLFRGVESRRESWQATLRVGLTLPETRSMTSEELVLNLRPELYAAADRISPERKVRLKLVEDPPGPPVRSTLLVRVQGHDNALLREVAEDLWPRVDQVDEVVDTDISVPEDRETVVVQIDHAAATRSRVSPAQIVETLNTAYDGSVLGIYHNDQNIEQEYITLRMARSFRDRLDDLRRLSLYNDLGIRVPLTDLVRIASEPTSKPLERENRMNTVYLLGDMGDRSITYAAIDLLFFLADYEPAGAKLESFSLFGADYRMPEGRLIRINMGGEWELTLEVFRDLGIAMGVAIFLVYFVLVGQFGSFREPLIIMSTIPLSLVGVLPGFMVLDWTIGLYFTATSMIGVIALAGIAVNNSIILLEYLNDLKKEGLALEHALVEAGATRFRPIMLTTVTTMLGSLTIASDPVWAGLAWAIVLGLGVSSALTLIVFPVLYFLIKGKDWPGPSIRAGTAEHPEDAGIPGAMLPADSAKGAGVADSAGDVGGSRSRKRKG